MREADIVGFALMFGLLVLLVFALLALIAGNIVSQLFAPVPSIAGPVGAAVALVLFIFLLTRSAEVVLGFLNQ